MGTYQFLDRLKLLKSSTFHTLHHQALEDSSKYPCMHAQKLCFFIQIKTIRKFITIIQMTHGHTTWVLLLHDLNKSPFIKQKKKKEKIQ